MPESGTGTEIERETEIARGGERKIERERRRGREGRGEEQEYRDTFTCYTPVPEKGGGGSEENG